MRCEIRLSHRAERDLDRLDKPTQKRMMRRLKQLAEDPYDPRISAPRAGLRAHIGVEGVPAGGKAGTAKEDDQAGAHGLHLNIKGALSEAAIPHHPHRSRGSFAAAV